MKIAPIAAIGLALILPACGGEPQTAATGDNAANPIAGATTDAKWLETVAETPEGGFLMGNPDAPVKLVEFGSMTCHVCAEFAEEGMEPLKAYIATGKVSLEFRNYVRDPVDIAMSLLARCAGTGPFYKLTEQMFAAQDEFVGKMGAMTADQQAAIGAMPQNQQYAALAKAAGIDVFAQQRGLSVDRANACLGDMAQVERLVQMNKTATDSYQISGTPSFLINGQVAPNAYNWATLEPQLKAALGG